MSEHAPAPSSSPQEYRDKLAAQIRSLPKEERKEFLDSVRNDPEYWATRRDKLEASSFPYEPIPSAYDKTTVEKYHSGQKKTFKAEGEEKKESHIPDIPTEGVVEALRKNLAEVPNARIVDIGSGARIDFLERWRRASPDTAVVIGIEPSRAMIEHTKEVPHDESIQIQPGDWLNTRLPREIADMVVGRYSFHHVEDINAAYQELARILKIGGKAVIEVPHPKFCEAELEQEIKEGKRPIGPLVSGTPMSVNVLGAQIHYFYHSLDSYFNSSALQGHFKVLSTRAGDWKRGTWDLSEEDLPNALEFIIERIK